MNENYVKDMLEDLKSLAQLGDANGIIAMCENEIETINQRTIKRDVVSALRIIEDAKYEITRLRSEDIEGLYKMLNEASTILRNLVIKKELNIESANENV
mgnify:CR=1 FL=1